MPPSAGRPPGGRPLNVTSEIETIVVEPDDWAARAADVLEDAIRASIADRGRCVLGISGGSTPDDVFASLGARDLPWEQLTLVQVDERIAVIGSGDRNLTGQLEAFTGLPVRWLPLPVAAPISEGMADFVDGLHLAAGSPPAIDVLHLGLGSDGHTASLVPGDPVLEVLDRDVAITGFYKGNQRITLTRPVLDNARLVIWLVKGSGKAEALAKMIDHDVTIPAGLLRPARSIVVADTHAASRLDR